MISRRDLLMTGLAGTGVAGAALLTGTANAAREMPTGAESAKLFLPADDLAASRTDRLPLQWSKERTRALQARLAAEGYDGILLTDQWNVIYFTGLFHTTTERMIHAFIPTRGDAPVWFYPALDRDLIRSWWYGDGDMYFDWHDVEGTAPHEGKVSKGPTTDLWRWALRGLKRRGYAGKKLAADKELVPSAQKTAVEELGGQMGSAAADCMHLRQRKTPEELALTRRAYGYFDRIHAFARDLLLTRGTDLTDFAIANAAEKFGTDLIMADIRRDGDPHSAVGIQVNISCRVGKATGYPHPNQFHYNKVERGKALQIAGAVRIGGCGGELSRKGVPCSEVAYAIHQHQVKAGVQKYIYHRPAHGEGMEGHQPPYLALGDHTPLDTGMCFSVEPGLFDPETGTGSNFSDMFTVRDTGPSRQMSRLPWSEEWAWIKL